MSRVAPRLSVVITRTFVTVVLFLRGRGLGTPLKLIPLLGGSEQNVLIPDQDGKNALEKEIAYFGARMNRYPDRNVIYARKSIAAVEFCIAL